MVEGDRAARVAVAFARHATGVPPTRLCEACVEVLHVSGAGITLMSGHNSGPVCSSDSRTGVLEDLQFTLGEGPCRDAFDSGEPAVEADLRQVADGRWPAYTPPALAAGARGVFAYPLGVGAQRIGVLTLYQDEAGGLSVDQAADSLVVAGVVAHTMLSIQADAEGAGLAEGLTDESAHRAEVHQATGMVAVQLGMSVDQALVRLRAHAYASDTPLVSLAADVVARRLRLDLDLPGGDL